MYIPCTLLRPVSHPHKLTFGFQSVFEGNQGKVPQSLFTNHPEK